MSLPMLLNRGQPSVRHRTRSPVFSRRTPKHAPRSRSPRRQCGATLARLLLRGIPYASMQLAPPIGAIIVSSAQKSPSARCPCPRAWCVMRLPRLPERRRLPRGPASRRRIRPVDRALGRHDEAALGVPIPAFRQSGYGMNHLELLSLPSTNRRRSLVSRAVGAFRPAPRPLCERRPMCANARTAPE